MTASCVGLGTALRDHTWTKELVAIRRRFPETAHAAAFKPKFPCRVPMPSFGSKRTAERGGCAKRTVHRTTQNCKRTEKKLAALAINSSRDHGIHVTAWRRAACRDRFEDDFQPSNKKGLRAAQDANSPAGGDSRGGSLPGHRNTCEWRQRTQRVGEGRVDEVVSKRQSGGPTSPPQEGGPEQECGTCTRWSGPGWCA